MLVFIPVSSVEYIEGATGFPVARSIHNLEFQFISAPVSLATRTQANFTGEDIGGTSELQDC